MLSTIHAQGNSVQNTVYNVSYTNSNHKYFRLTQYDYDGANEMLGVVSVDCGNEEKTIQGIYNLQGQKVTMDSVGINGKQQADELRKGLLQCFIADLDTSVKEPGVLRRRFKRPAAAQALD